MDTTSGKNKSGRRAAGIICNVIGIILIVIIIALCSMLVLPGMFGYNTYNVISGSMEPEIGIGSLIYVKYEDPEQVAAGDIIAFYDAPSGSAITTHRVVENNTVAGRFITKGDANEVEDLTPTNYGDFIGVVTLVIPRMGEVLTILSSTEGKIAAACMVGAGAVLCFLGSRLKSKSA